MSHLDGAVLHGVEHLQARHDFTGRKSLDLKFVVGGLADGLGHHLGRRHAAYRAISASSSSCAI